mmetsp:Transcript_54559/g.128734  ORF Transcript_54559/g.128734 Transcript_54559/m.128734 type:complete len:277 (-) Transcript_54559:248-1078(-)
MREREPFERARGRGWWREGWHGCGYHRGCLSRHLDEKHRVGDHERIELQRELEVRAARWGERDVVGPVAAARAALLVVERRPGVGRHAGRRFQDPEPVPIDHQMRRRRSFPGGRRADGRATQRGQRTQVELDSPERTRVLLAAQLRLDVHHRHRATASRGLQPERRLVQRGPVRNHLLPRLLDHLAGSWCKLDSQTCHMLFPHDMQHRVALDPPHLDLFQRFLALGHRELSPVPEERGFLGPGLRVHNLGQRRRQLRLVHAACAVLEVRGVDGDRE